MSCAVKIAIGVVVGGGLGFGLSRLLCTTGGCPITSNRPLMVALGAALGGWLALSGCSGADTRTDDHQTRFGTPLTTDADFRREVLASGRPALVDYSADWCPPCQRLKPVLAELEGEYAGRVAFFTVDVDAAEELARAHGIRAVPTLRLFRDGEPAGSIGGPFTAERIRDALDALLAGS